MLKKVVRAVLDLNGVDFIMKPQFLNVLNDHKAFDEYPGARFVLKSIIQDGFVVKILDEFSNQGDAIGIAEKFVSDLYTNYGFRRDIAVEIINTLLFATGHNGMLHCAESSEVITTEQCTANEPHIVFSQISLAHSIRDIERHMSKRGFKTIATKPYQISMEGTFCGIDDTKLYINGSPSGLTKSVVLRYNYAASSIHFSNCKTLYNLLYDKYGEADSYDDPLHSLLHGFDYDYYLKNICEYSRLIDNYGNIFSAKWNVYGGQIELYWLGETMGLTYTDSINSELADRHQEQFNSESI